MTSHLRQSLVVIAALAALAVIGGPAMADDFEDSVQAALEAYRDGDIKLAKEEIDFASQILSQMKSAQLQNFLPEALEGWVRKDGNDDSAAMAMFGGGQAASASYSRDGENVEIQIMADNQMVTAMATMFSNTALMGSMGKVKRINRQKVVITNDNEIQTLIDGRIMIQISGNADLEAKEAYFKAIDLKALKENL